MSLFFYYLNSGGTQMIVIIKAGTAQDIIEGIKGSLKNLMIL